VTAVRESNTNTRTSFKKQTSPIAEAVEVLANLVLNHVPVHQYNFRGKIIYVTHIIRRVLRTVRDRTLLDDKVRFLPCICDV
jgi:DNA-directed RNA polymerase III subunit RPC2